MSIREAGGNTDRPPVYAGDLFIRLAVNGQLKVDAVLADRTIADLERTLCAVRSRLMMLSERRCRRAGFELRPGVVEVVFQEQMFPGRLERAAVEIPKYLEALRRARVGPAQTALAEAGLPGEADDR
jgi:hypothetical protein